MPTFQTDSPLTSGPYTGDYNWNTGLNWDTGMVPTDGSNVVLPTLAEAYTSVDDIPSISGINLSIGDNVSLIVAQGDTSVENINAFGNNSLFQTDGTSTVSIGNGLGGDYAVNGPAATMDITGFNGVGTFDLFGGTIDFGTNANLSAGNSFNFEGDTSGNLEIDSQNNYLNGWTFPVANFGQGDTITFGTSFFTPGTYTNAYDAAAHTLTLPIPTGSGAYVFQNFSLASGAPTTFNVTSTTIMDGACFAANTRILTNRGEVAVEKLAIGDLVVTASGGAKPIKWIGRRPVDCSRHPDPKAVWPIRVYAGAFGENKPSRDLWLSPGHNIASEGVLMPIDALQNGKSVAQHEQSTVEYWHIELEQHNIIIADGLPAESYLDTGNRTVFINGGAFIEAHPDFEPKHWADACLPLVTKGPEIVRTKAMLLEQLKGLGHVTTSGADLHLIADDKRIEPMELGAKRFAFALPAGCADIRLLSRTFIPAHTLAHSTDTRSLGVCVSRLQIDGENISLDDGSLDSHGWNGLERLPDVGDQRWTRGNARLPANTRLVLIDLARRGYYWQEPRDNVVALFG